MCIWIIGMTLKSASFLALCASILLAALLLVSLIWNIVGVLRGLIPALTLFSSVVYAFAGLSAAMFFYVFHVKQP